MALPVNTATTRMEQDSCSLLSPSHRDPDAALMRSDHESDSDDDERQRRARNSRELLAHDRRLVLMEEDEINHLITESRRQQERKRSGSGFSIPNPLRLFSQNNSDASRSRSRSRSRTLAPAAVPSTVRLAEKRRTRRARRKAKKDRLTAEAQHGEDGELMYEMEEGGIKEGSSTGDTSERDCSEEVDRQALLHLNKASKKRGRTWRRWLFIHSIISVTFAILVLVAWKLSRGHRASNAVPMVTNGTAWFAPTTIIVSLDGFRADFLQRGLTPRLNAFVREGASPPYMTPSFPSVTFPNHYTIATGLYPESHGVVGNTFWDPVLGEEFYYTDPSRSMDAKWWDGEPFWVTAEKAGLKTAIHMWPGSEAHILGVEPSYVDKYNGKEALSNKVARILEFLDMPSEERPRIIAAYVPNIDADGHRYGPNSTEIMDTIRNVDAMLDNVFQGLDQRNLTNIVNVIVVSDHGMATTDVSRLIQLEDVVDVSRIEHTDGWPLIGLRPKKVEDLLEIHAGLVEKAKSYPGIDVYLRDHDMPARYHFSKNARIAPLWIVPKAGWALVHMNEMNLQVAKASGAVYHPRGLHGYDHEHPLMRAIFVARGPAFPHQPNSRLDVFQNIEIYNILCDSVGLAPKPNNGTLRLPLKPIGLHDEGAAGTLPDPEHSNSSAAPSDPSPADTIGVNPPSPEPARTSAHPASESATQATDGEGEDLGDSSMLGESGPTVQDVWDWLTGKVKDWWDTAMEAASKVGSS